MAMSYHEWLRANPGRMRADWDDYLSHLARIAQAANQGIAQRAPGAVISSALEGWDEGMGQNEAMAADVLAALEDAGYVIADARPDGPGHYTREQVSDAVNGAASLLPDHGYESEETIARDDAVNFVVNAALHLLDHPGADENEVIAAQYTDVEIGKDDLDEGEEVPERGSARWNELVVARVLGWLAP